MAVSQSGRDEQTLFSRRLFVSYEDSDGKRLAIQAKAIFEAAGHTAWVWCVDGGSGVPTHEEISSEIQARDRVFYICTPSSHASRGQRYERAQALTWEKHIDVIAFDLNDVSGEIRHANALVIARAAFDETCANFADELSRSPTPSIRAAARQDEASPITVAEVGFGIDAVIVEKTPS